MPRYQIQAPDGRTVTVEGDRPPTQEDAQKIFAQLPASAEVGRRRALDINAPGRMDIERGLLRTEAGRQRLTEAEGQGILAPRAAPGLLLDIAAEGGGAAAGQAVGALTGPAAPVAIPVLGGLGGGAGNLLSQYRRIEAGEQEKFQPGQFLGSIVTGAVPGSPIAASPLRAGARQAATGLAGKTVETMIDEGRVPSGPEAAIVSGLPAVGGAGAQRMQAANPTIAAAITDAAAANAGKRATLAAGQSEGLILPPSTVNPSFVNRKLEGIAGKEAVSQGASLKNAPKTTAIARRELGLKEGPEITESDLRAVRDEASKPYAEIEAMATKAKKELDEVLAKTSASGAHETEVARALEGDRIKTLTVQAAADVTGLRTARERAGKLFADYRQNKTVASLDEAEKQVALANELENRIEAAATEFGTPDMLDRLRAGRERIAKSWDIERSLNIGDYSVSAASLGRQMDKGAPLSGGLERVARFQQAFPKSMRDASSIPTPGVSKIQQGLMLLSAVGGYGATGSPYGMLAGLAPLTSDAARGLVLSQPYQRFATRIPLSVDVRPDNRALLARTLIQEGAQELAEEAKPTK